MNVEAGLPFQTDTVVHGAGSIPAIDALEVEWANVGLDNGSLILDNQLRSVSNPRIFAVGDA